MIFAAFNEMTTLAPPVVLASYVILSETRERSFVENILMINKIFSQKDHIGNKGILRVAQNDKVWTFRMTVNTKNVAAHAHCDQNDSKYKASLRSGKMTKTTCALTLSLKFYN